ncbi:MAG: TIGR03809 family protein [Bryobacteraceae bacterium]
MTYQLDVAGGRDIVARWCTLAEQRLQYLTELFETGRWRRFHTELGFLENIQEAKAAVDLWRDLLSCGTSRHNSTPGMSRLETSANLPSVETLRRQMGRMPQQPAIPSETSPAIIAVVPETSNLQPLKVQPAPTMPATSRIRQNISSIAERYPLLRNSL